VSRQRKEEEMKIGGFDKLSHLYQAHILRFIYKYLNLSILPVGIKLLADSNRKKTRKKNNFNLKLYFCHRFHGEEFAVQIPRGKQV
jgi:hypothetical protein